MPKSQVWILKKLIDKYGGSVTDKMMDGAESGMLDTARKMQAKGQILTVDTLTEDIRQNDAFLAQMSRVGVQFRDFQVMAERILEKLGPSKITEVKSVEEKLGFVGRVKKYLSSGYKP